jgi:peptide chain release factor subunit 1
VRDTLACLEMGAVETLIVWENLETTRAAVVNPATGAADVRFFSKEQEAELGAHLTDKATGAVLDVVEKAPLLEWFAENYKKFGCALEFVTNRSQEGSQFCRGFGGIGGVLRYQVDTAEFEDEYGSEGGLGGASGGESDGGWSTSDSDI